MAELGAPGIPNSNLKPQSYASVVKHLIAKVTNSTLTYNTFFRLLYHKPVKPKITVVQFLSSCAIHLCPVPMFQEKLKEIQQGHDKLSALLHTFPPGPIYSHLQSHCLHSLFAYTPCKQLQG